ncbi:MAG: lysophospholipid acyltransferase family protein, partial [Acidimicrobiales bacterium]
MERTLGVDYDTAWARRYGVRLLRAVLLDDVVRPGIQVLTRPRVGGLDRLQGVDPPVILAANHQSHVDYPLVLVSLPPRLRYRTVVAAGADYFFDRRWKAALSAAVIGAIPIERRRANRRSTELPASLLADGWSVIIFPEGGRSPDGWAQPFHGGAAYLATRLGVPVVPLHLKGTGRIHAKWRPGLHRGTTRVTFG